MPSRSALRVFALVVVLAALPAAFAPVTGSGGAAAASPAGTPTATPGPLESIAEGLAGVKGNTYVSPTYGWRLTWDPTVWQVVSADSVAFNDRLTLAGVDASDQISFRANRRYEGDAAACLRDQIRGYREDPSVAAVEVLTPPPTTDGRVSAILSLTTANSSAMRAYVECRRFAPDETTLLADYLVPTAVYDERFPLVTALLAAVETPAEAGSAAAGVSGNAYLSPTWGWRLSWDAAVWTVEGASSAAGVDVLQLGTPDQTATFRAAEEDAGGAFACVEERIDARRRLAGVTDFAVTEGPAGDAARASARLTFTYPAGGRAIEEYVECRSLVPDRAVLSIDDYAYSERFAEGFPLFEDLLAAIVLPDEQGS